MIAASPGHAADPPVRVRTYRPGDETAILALLNEVFAAGWGDLRQWRAKHSHRAAFDPSEIVLAEREGVLIGCLHSAMFPVRIAPGAAVLAAVDGDLAVRPGARGSGVAELLYAASSELLRQRGVALRCGYANPDVGVHFYRRVLGYVSGFDRTVAYNKTLNPALLRAGLLRLFDTTEEEPDPGRGPTVEIAVGGVSLFLVRLGPKGVAPVRHPAARGDLRVEVCQKHLNTLHQGDSRLAGFIRLWLLGALRVRGPWRARACVLLWLLGTGVGFRGRGRGVA